MMVFFARPSRLQSWAELFGHEWRHVGITVQTSEGLRVASYAAKGCYRLDDPEVLLPSYTRIGVANIFSTDAEIERVERFCRQFEHFDRSDSPYSLGGVLVGPIHLAARRRKLGPIRSFMFAIVKLYCWLQRSRYRDRDAFLCSTFVWAAVACGRQEPLRIPLTAHPDDEAAYATPSTDEDELFARWLCGPTELWRSVSPASRSELELPHLQQQLTVDQAIGEAGVLDRHDASHETGVVDLGDASDEGAVINLRVAPDDAPLETAGATGLRKRRHLTLALTLVL